MRTKIAELDDAEAEGFFESAVVRRKFWNEKMYLCVPDFVYLAETSRDRYLVEGNAEAAEAMDQLAFVVCMLALRAPPL